MPRRVPGTERNTHKCRYRTAGTPFCFTIDGQTKEDGTITVRNRDDASQERIDKSRCLEYLREKLGL